MVEELRQELEKKKAEAQKAWERIEEMRKEAPKRIPLEEEKQLEDKREESPLKGMMSRIGLKKEKQKEGADWTRIKSNID